MADLANIFNDEEAGSDRANSITSSDLDPFLLQGDDQTWAVEDWNWDPFNMFAAPKETPNVACCQALKRRKVTEQSATSAPQQPAQQQQPAACQPCHGASGSRAGPPAAPAAACCSMAPGVQQHAPAPAPAQQLAGPLQTALNSMMPGQQQQQQQQRVADACGISSMCHAPGMVAPPPPMPVAAPVAVTGHQAGGMGMGHMNPAMGNHMGWPGMPDMSNPAAAAAAAAAASFFPGMGAGARGPLAAMGWGAQPMSLQMPGMALPGFPGSHAQCAPALQMPSMAFPTPSSGIFNQQASMAVPPSALPSPALGSSGDTTSLQGSADNCAKPPCCSGNRATGPTCSGGRQQADSSNKAAPPPPKQPAHNAGGARGAGAAAPAPGDLSDFNISDSEDDDEVARRPSAAGTQRGGNAALNAAAYANLGDIVSLQDVGDDTGAMVCQVPGCGKDLTNLKEYHQRYRICDVHIKLQQVLKDGRLQRFCQQCGRFHDLTAFDGNRKSCRDQLSKHNARRRRRAQAEQAKGRAAAQEAAAAAAGAMAAAAAVGGAAGGAAAAAAGFEGGDIGKLLACLMQNPTQLHALRLLLGVPTHPALPMAAPAAGLGMAAGGDAAAQPDQARTYGLARDILAGRNEFSPAFESEHRMIRLSMKLFNKTPADLPHDLRNQVTSWLASAPLAMEASIRPGCVFLTVQMLVDEAGAAQAAAPGALHGLVEHLLTRTGSPFWHLGMYTVQMGTDMLLVRDGKVAGDANVNAAGAAAPPAAGEGAEATVRVRGDGRFPVVRRLGPLAAVAGQPTVLKLHGMNLDAPGCCVILRWGNKHLKAHLQALSTHRAIVRLPPLPDLCGPVWVEVARGAYLSPAKQLLVARNEELVQEINKLDVKGGPLRPDTVELLLQDMALVLQHIATQPGVAAQLSHATIALKARRLLAMACDMGWAAVASAVLPLACARCSCAAEMVAAIHAASTPSQSGAPDKRGLTLLHRAVRSGSVSLLAGMLAWGDSHGYRWRVDAEGPAGITPLHLSAMLDDARIGLLLLDHCGWPAAFTHLRSDGGVTPFHLAFQMGHYQVDALMSALGGLHQVADPNNNNNAAGAGAAAAPPSRRSRCGNTAAVGCKPDPDEDVKPDLAALQRGGRNGGGSGSCTELDPCENCHCTLPPLLLSIMASCTDCGRRRMCMETECNNAAQRCGECGCGGSKPSARVDSGEVCSSRQHGTIFNITALCQGCHANRTLAVA